MPNYRHFIESFVRQDSVNKNGALKAGSEIWIKTKDVPEGEWACAGFYEVMPKHGGRIVLGTVPIDRSRPHNKAETREAARLEHIRAALFTSEVDFWVWVRSRSEHTGDSTILGDQNGTSPTQVP